LAIIASLGEFHQGDRFASGMRDERNHEKSLNESEG
jgi:hypothetical protein